MQANPLVSIITPSFNQAQFLEEAMRSVLEQDYPNLEYWVIDGKSTDGSLEIIKRYSDRLAGWVSEKDKGQADGINKGFNRSQGEIVAWLNSDDRYLPRAVSNAVAFFQKYPDAAFVYSDVESIDEAGKSFNLMRYGRWKLADLMQFNIIGQPGVFMNREVLEKAGHLDPNYHYLLDHHLWLRMANLADPIYAQGQVWAQARIHSKAKNVSDAEKFGPEAFRLAKWIGSEERFYPQNARYHRKIWAGAYRLNAFYMVDAGSPNKARKLYQQSFKLDPWMALKHWKHWSLALAGSLGLKNFRAGYDALRKRFYAKKHKDKHGA
ncbi:MAG TPA: glycosyltransferase family 2 protein [Anaerolineaceae bacterium]|nr:glycosyltransferase family 2 protein [Anaerolineaceae bacterium]